MKHDVGSNYTLAEAVASTESAVGAVNSASVDHADAPSVSFFISLGEKGAAGTLDAKVQHSPDDSTWTDDDGASGNDTAIVQLTANGTAQLNVPNPQARYSRVVLTVGTNAVDCGVTSVLGPLRHVGV
jgi:hypothetical protein